MIRRTIRPDTGHIGPSGWSSQSGDRAGRGAPRGLTAIVLIIPLVLGLLGSSVSPQAVGAADLAHAKAKQTALKEQVAAQKARVAVLNDLQAGLAAEIGDTAKQLRAVGADLTAVKRKIVAMEARIGEVKAAYAELVVQVEAMDLELEQVVGQEAAKRIELSERQALLADRVRNAYDTDRTSPLEAFLSGGTFTDLLAEMSYYIDVGEQDQALADQITRDTETLAILRQTVADTRARTNLVRQETAAQKRALDKSLLALQETKAELARLQKAVAKALREQKARFAALKRSEANAARIIRQMNAAQRKLASKIDGLIKQQARQGRIPSEFNGTFTWPLVGTITQDFGCTGFSWEQPAPGCPSGFHRGIDIKKSDGAPVRTAADGVVVFVGFNPYDAPGPQAWIVIVAHSAGLQTWYAHMQARAPSGVVPGAAVKRGQVIGYQGSTGRSTGSHLHWAVEQNGSWANPRLFL